MDRSVVALLTVLGALTTSVARAEDLVRRHSLPEGAASPDVVVREKVVHLVYGKGRDAFHQRSEDGGLTFGEPTRVNDPPGTVFSAMERGPRLAVTADGTVHVVWSPDRLLGVNYARLRPGADAFERARDLRYEGATAAEGATVAAHGEHVLILWLDGRTGEPRNSPTGLSIFGRLSKDGGQTFDEAGPVAHDYDGGACACCHLSAAVDADGRFVVAFRGARGGVRDVFLLRGDGKHRRFRVARVTQDEWQFRGCPMDGPRIGQGKDHLLVAHTVDGKIGFSHFDGRLRAPERPGAPRGKFPLALQRPDGATLLAWVDGDGVKWAVRDERGTALGEGALPAAGMSRPAGFVDGDGLFVLVY
ncbi:MAG: hypothetical protein KIT58_01020 [Planctomycetota bacterium]|nr:hypothetical protein [Planctomycetota bacterium]